MKTFLRHIKTHPSTWIALFVALVSIGALFFSSLGILGIVGSIAFIIQDARESVQDEAITQMRIKATNDLATLANSRTREEQLKATLRQPPLEPDYFPRERNVNPPNNP